MRRETLRAKRERHNCTDAGNAERLAALMRAHKFPLHPKLAACLPAMLRAEAAEARAQLLTMKLPTDETIYEWSVIAERTITLEAWAAACEYPSVQERAIESLETMMTKETA